MAEEKIVWDAPKAEKEVIAWEEKKPQKYAVDEDTVYSSDGIPLYQPSYQAEAPESVKKAEKVLTDISGAPVRFAMSLAKPMAGIAEYTGLSKPSKIVEEIDKGIKSRTGNISSGASLAGDIYAALGLGSGAKDVLMSGAKYVPQGVDKVKKAGEAFTNLPSYIKAPIIGGAYGAIEPTGLAIDEEGFATEKGKKTGLGALLGLGAERVGSVASNVLAPRLERLRQLKDMGVDIEKLKKEGTLGQILGGTAEKFERFLEAIPFSGVRGLVEKGEKSAKELAEQRIANASAELQREHAKFSTPYIQKALNNIGEKIPDGVTGNKAIAFAQDAIDASYKNALSKIGQVNASSDITSALSKVLENAKNKFGDAAPNLYKQLESDIHNTMMGQFKNGVMDADTWHAVYKEIGGKSFGMRGAQGFENEYGKALKQAHKIWGELAEKADPTGAIKSANRAFSALQIPQRAASYVTATRKAEGAFTPEQLLNAIKAESSPRAFASGRAPYQREAVEASSRMQAEREGLKESERQLRETIGDLMSTRQPHGLAHFLGYASPAAPVVGAGVKAGLSQSVAPLAGVLSPGGLAMMSGPTVVSRALYGNPLAQYVLKKLATERPELLKKAGQGLREELGTTVPAIVSPSGQ